MGRSGRERSSLGAMGKCLREIHFKPPGMPGLKIEI